MKVLATVLLGPGSDKSVGEAIESVRERVDGFVFIESGGGQAALNAALDTYRSDGSRYIKRVFRWTGNYGEARQFALDAAAECGADYALTLDPDERVTLPENYRDKLRAFPEIHVWILENRTDANTYHKERLLRCGVGLKWHGRVCENIDGGPPSAKLDGEFRELPKDEAAENRRYERGVVEMRRMIGEGDDRFKWWRHLGQCLVGLQRYDEAVEAFETALTKNPGPEERAWTTYLLCEQLVLRQQYQRAHDLAAQGLAQHAGFIPEFGSILAYVQYLAGDYQNASRWAQLVLMVPPDRTRISFRSGQAAPRAKEVLARAHQPRTPARRLPSGEVDLGGVLVPITERFSPLLTRAVETGVYEAAERELLDALLTPGDRVLELGAGCGYLAAVAAKKLGDDAVLAVEADPEMLDTLCTTFHANGVSPHLRMGAVTRDGSPRAVVPAEHFWSTKTEPGGSAASLALPSLMAEHQPTVLVCDIEGGEAEFCGLPLPPKLRAVVIETHGEAADAGVRAWLEGEGYVLRTQRGRTLAYHRRAA